MFYSSSSSSSSSSPMGVYGSPMNGTYENDEIWHTCSDGHCYEPSMSHIGWLLVFSLFVLQDGIRVSDVIMAEDLHLCWS